MFFCIIVLSAILPAHTLFKGHFGTRLSPLNVPHCLAPPCQRNYNLGRPIGHEVLKVRIWGVPPAGGFLL